VSAFATCTDAQRGQRRGAGGLRSTGRASRAIGAWATSAFRPTGWASRPSGGGWLSASSPMSNAGSGTDCGAARWL